MIFMSAFIFSCFFLSPVHNAIQMTNVKCDAYHLDFATFSECRLKVVGRGVISLNVHVNLYQVPVSNVSVNLSLHRKANGYRPFLYNLTSDFCKFMTNRKQNLFLKIVVDAMLERSNFNHSCPYDHDIILDNFIPSETMFQYLPLPNGEYMFQVMVGAYNDWKAKVRLYVELNTKFGN